ncbi:hypothetical protein [Arsenophonus endosymbiont of Apis mellifera]|uniref:hypothetical protein n=1 Tax=Arsenophonus endosymbiont of Apis mellifera TaxID=1541805 RepID=UPI0015D88F03|nr:hypothetical protein [Arsenophonus endosymbiont of Apis mellifera]
MRWLKNLILTLVILIIFIYLIIQTQWGAKQLSDILSKYTLYDVKIGVISHHLTRPGEIVLQDIAIHNKQNSFKLNVKQITFELQWQKIFTDSWLHRLIVTEGELTLPSSRQIFPFNSKILQLENMNVSYRIGNIGLSANNMTGGIIPWQPTAHNPFGEGNFQFTTEQFEINNIHLTTLLVKGSYKTNFLFINELSAYLNNGVINASAIQYTDQALTLAKLMLTNTGWQFSSSLSQLANKLLDIKKLNIKQLNLTDTHFEGKDWAIAGLSGKVNNIVLSAGNWNHSNSEISLNIDELIYKNQQISQLMADMTFANDILHINRLAGYYDKGLFNIEAKWHTKQQSINIINAQLAGIRYQLADDWFNFFQSVVPNWLNSLHITNFKLTNSLLMDVNVNFPFELTNVNGYLSNIDLIKQKKWGLWQGKGGFMASSGTLNQITLRQPYIQVLPHSDRSFKAELNSNVENGLVKLTANIQQQANDGAFSLSANGINVDLAILNHWGWKNLPIQTLADFDFTLKGNLLAKPIAQTLTGELFYQTVSGEKKAYSMIKGEITVQSDSQIPLTTANEEKP